eukprot:gene7937-8756_t
MSDSEKDDKENLIADIFGDSDDDFQPAPAVASSAAAQAPPAGYLDSDDGSIFGDSDDDKPKPAANKTSKLKRNSVKFSSSAGDNLLDSDDEQPGRIQFDKRKRKSDSKKSKQRISKKAKASNSSGQQQQEQEKEEGDEYDSGEEAVRTREDDDFIDDDDEHADLVKEYDDDNQDFADERPLPKKGSKKSSSSSSSAYTGSSAPRGKETDPLSQTLLEMKAPKARQMTAAEMETFVDRLQRRMDHAQQEDDKAFQRHQPATHKLALLPLVRQAVGMKALQNTLLERDFLCSLRDWIRPRDADTLPSLTVRSAVYEMLRDLPALSEHLKRGGGKEPIGFVIVALRKHKAETPENKRLLKEIMDKWSRPIFTNSSGDSRGGITALHEAHDEVKRAMIMQYVNREKDSQQDQRSREGESSDLFAGARSSKESEVDVGRARMPLSAGYLFTVQPESRVAAGKDPSSAYDEARERLYKKTIEGKRSKGEAGAGKKSNPRAISLSVSGRNLSM